MKTRNPLFVICGIVLFLSLALLACTTSRKTALACPEFSRYPSNKSYAVNGRYKNNILSTENRATKHKHHNNQSGIYKTEYILTHENSTTKENNAPDNTGNAPGITKIEFNQGLLAAADNRIVQSVRTNYYSDRVNHTNTAEPFADIITQTSGCDTIVLSSGSVLLGKVEEIGQIEIRYRKCDNLSGPVISILKSEVAIIKYSNGTHDSIASDKPIPVGNPDLFVRQTPVNAPAKTEGFAIAGFISGLVGLFIAGIPLGALAVIFGTISINKIRKYPARFKGRGLAIASIVLGFVCIIGAIIVIAAM